MARNDWVIPHVNCVCAVSVPVGGAHEEMLEQYHRCEAEFAAERIQEAFDIRVLRRRICSTWAISAFDKPCDSRPSPTASPWS